MSNNKWALIVIILAVSLCAETCVMLAVIQPAPNLLGWTEGIDLWLVGFTSNSSAMLQIVNVGYNPVTMMDWIMVNGMNATLTPFGYPNASLPVGAGANFTVTLLGENQFSENIEYTFVIKTASSGTHWYITSPFYPEPIIT